MGEDVYADFVATVRRALTTEPEVALGPLEARMHRLADDERFEEAAATRDRLGALARALDRRRTVAMWRGVARLVVDCDGQRVEIHRGRIIFPEDQPTLTPADEIRVDESFNDSSTRDAGREPNGDLAEILVVDRWVARNANRLQVVEVDGELVCTLPRIGANPAKSP